MNHPILVARVEPGTDSGTVVRAPAVGWWSGIPRPGSVVGEGSHIGYLDRLGRRYLLELPRGASGCIVGGLPQGRRVALEYGELLFRLAPVESSRVGQEGTPDPGEDRAGDLPGGAWAVVAPTDGVFYRRPAPDVEAYVDVGTRIRRGDAIGLVEVMKTFNQIVFDDPLAPDEVEVLEVRGGDGEEVSAGQVLVVVR